MDDYGLGPQSIAMDAIRECPPYGMYLLQAELIASGHETELADLIAPGTDSIANYSLDGVGLVGIGATSMSWPTALRVIRQVKERAPDTPIVVGGIHPTMFDWYVLSTFAVDFVIRGEGELALVALANALEHGHELQTVPNLTWPARGRIVRNPAAPKLDRDRLASCALPDYSQLPEGVYQGLSIESSRGCGFDCSFCSTSYRRSFRGLEPARFVDRLEAVLVHQSRTRLPFTHIVDDEFSMNTRRAMAIADEIGKRNLHPALVYDSRATDLLVPGFVEAMVPYTFQFLVGAECGYDEGLERIGKGTTTKILTDAAEILHRYGIADRADYSFILGLPWESQREVRKTCEFALSLHERFGIRVLLQWYCQIPGSRLWQAARDAGDVTEAMYNEFGFFRDLYLFRSAVKLSNAEIDNITRIVRLAVEIASARFEGTDVIQYAHPESLRMYFPDSLKRRDSDALMNLREVARAGKPGTEQTGFVDLGPLPPRPDESLNELAGRPPRHIGL